MYVDAAFTAIRQKISVLLLVSISIVVLPLSTFIVGAQDTPLDVTFPAFTGPYAVGKVERHLIDEERDEIFTEDAEDKRELMVTFYYPAQPAAEAVPAPYVEGEIGDALGLTPELIAQIQTNVYAEAPIAAVEAGYPVVIFSPGMGNLPLTYSVIAEELVSNGYIVVAISHPYSTAITVFPDGRLVVMNDAGSRLHTDSEVVDAANRAKILAVWVGDVQFVLDSLERIGVSDPLLAGHLDLTRVGMYGHSFGGETTIETSSLDTRIQAALSLDSQVTGSVRETGITQPFMILRSEKLSLTDEELEAAGVTRERFDEMYAAIDEPIIAVYEGAETGYLLTLENSMHDTYTADYLLLASLFPSQYSPEVIGTINRERAVQIINTYVVAFFNKHLKGEEIPLLDSASADFPEVSFERHEN